MKTIYTRPSGKQFEVIEIIAKGVTKSLVKYKEGKYIVTSYVFNKRLSTI